MADDSADAKKVLEDVEYPDSLIDLSKAILDNTSINGILFTAGDNDTYPLWYLQEARAYRKDVLVINTSLLGLRRYVKMLDKKSGGTLFVTKSNVYSKNNFDYFYYNKPLVYAPPMEVGKFISILNNIESNKNKDSVIIYKGECLKSYYVKELYFNNIGVNPVKNTTDNKTIKLKDYVLMNEFMLLDIINNNINKRSIFFTYNDEMFSTFLNMEDYIYKFNLTA